MLRLGEGVDAGLNCGEVGAGEGAEEGDVCGELVEVWGEVFGAEGGETFVVRGVGVEGEDVGIFVFVGGVGYVVGSARVIFRGVGT